MYYTATEARSGDQCIGVARRPRPTRSLHGQLGAPVVCQNGADAGVTVDNGDFGGSIDPDIFTDPGR